MHTKKIGIVCPYNIFRPGGVQTTVIDHQRELIARGHEVHVIAPLPRQKPLDRAIKNLILIGSSVELNTPFHTMIDVARASDTQQLESLLHLESFDILHFHEPWVPVLSMQLLSRSKTVNVATFHAKLPDTTLSKYIEKGAIYPYSRPSRKKLHAMAAVSPPAAELVESIIKDPVPIIPNGIDTAVYDQNLIAPYPDYDDNIKNIVYVGRLEKRKGVAQLLKAYRLLRENRNDCRLIIAGDGKLMETLSQYVERHDLPDVDFLGFVSEDTKLQLLKSATVYCAPAMYGESFGIVLLEAMAMGCVVLAGDNPGYASVMTDRGSISLVNVRKTKQFAQRLDLLLHDETVRAGLQSWAQETLPKYAYETIMDQYEDLYQTAATNHAAGQNDA